MSAASASAPEPADTRPLRKAFGTFSTGITVVTVGGRHPHGMTANSFTAVSLAPPLVLVCIDREATMHGTLSGVRTFGVSVLGAGQAAIARHFADRTRPLGWAQFDSVEWDKGPLTGAPLIDGALSQFECERWRTYAGGDHTIFVGRVLSALRSGVADALVYFESAFRQLTLIPEGTRP